MAITNTNTKTATSNGNPATALWRIVVAEFEQAVVVENRVGAELDAATAAWNEAVPDRTDEFLAYGLNRYSAPAERDAAARDRLIRSTEMQVAMVDYKGRSPLTADDFAEIARKATTLVDDFLAWIALDREATPRIYGDVQERFDEACDKRTAATSKLLATPAPDTSAMIFKLELLAVIMREHLADDADEIEAIRDDAKRLFGEAA